MWLHSHLRCHLSNNHSVWSLSQTWGEYIHVLNSWNHLTGNRFIVWEGSYGKVGCIFMWVASMLVSQILFPQALQPSLKFNVSKLVYMTPWSRKHFKHRAHSRYDGHHHPAGWYITVLIIPLPPSWKGELLHPSPLPFQKWVLPQGKVFCSSFSYAT